MALNRMQDTLLLRKLAGQVRYHPELGDRIKSISSKVSALSLANFQKELLSARREAWHPLNPKLLFESLFLSYQQMMQEKAA